ncbi:glutathione S-transferase [Roseibium algae]|uniref:Glutathione S-transferase n=1 Tax=Roseibium algae TaxID=3123038 RepID=A0ABU8TJ80_9HYPH
MKLHWSPRSPFVRKVMIVLHETDQLSEVNCERSLVAVHLPPNPDVIADNPLGKIPTLILNDGTALFDSRVICEVLDLKAGTELFPSHPPSRIPHLRWQALADGLTDILLLWRTELTRETGQWDAVTSGWLIKVREAMAALEREAEALSDTPFGIGHIAVICALGQLDFRWPDCAWRDHFPALAKLENNLSQRPSTRATAVTDDQAPGANDVTASQLTFSK